MPQPNKTLPRLSLVIPIHNESESIKPLDAEIRKALADMGNPYEVIYVDDGSTDGSLREIRSLKDMKCICLRRNYGQATALDAGFKAASGDIVVTLDGDGQNDPADIPMLVAKMQSAGLDVMVGWRKERCDVRRVRIMTGVGRLLRRALLGDRIHDSGCTLRAYTKEAVKSLDLGGEMHRYIVAILRLKGFNIGETEVHDRPRRSGTSNYRSSKAFRGFFDLVYVWFIQKYVGRPIHFFGYVSMFSFAVGVASGAFALYSRIADGLSFNRNGWFFVSFFFLLASLFIFSMGVVLDFLIRLHLNSSPFEKRYYIRETISA